MARKRPFIVSLLYGEAEDQFLKGMLPCHEKHYIPMAAIISQRLYGSELPQNVE
uniref:Transcriptional regulator n=1 Tax=Meloidogyne hapla TaxID=6305 RepID=A0A1I8BDB9_MELHA